MGQWLEEYGHTIYGTRGGPFKPTDWSVSTRKKDRIYLHLLNWSGASSILRLPDIEMEITTCGVVGGDPLDFRREPGEIQIDLGEIKLDPINTIVELEVHGNAMEIEPVNAFPNMLGRPLFMKGGNASGDLNFSI
jgi:alpha-L-fucosidase